MEFDVFFCMYNIQTFIRKKMEKTKQQNINIERTRQQRIKH